MRARRRHLGIVLLHRGGDDHHLGVAEIVGAVTDLHGNAERAQPLHGVAEIGRDLGNAAHADAADADEMQRADVERDGPHAAFSRASGAGWPLRPSMVAMTRSASARAAWRRPRASA